jgi:hypothetical protein
MSARLQKLILEQLSKLSEDKQMEVLSYAQALAAHKAAGVPGSDLLRFAGAIPALQLDQMERAIEDGCEKVDRSEW